MTNPGFVHLRLRSEYSISDSIVRIDDAIAAAAADQQPALALTDSANLFGWVKFYRAAIAKGVQPLCGLDCWITNPEDRDRPHRLLLIAASAAGLSPPVPADLARLAGERISRPRRDSCPTGSRWSRPAA